MLCWPLRTMLCSSHLVSRASVGTLTPPPPPTPTPITTTTTTSPTTPSLLPRSSVGMLTKMFNDADYKTILGQMNTSLNLLLEKI
jgi:hypothetical protein